MNTPVIIMAVVIVGSGLVMLAVSLPLIRRKIPMNPYYGFRVKASFKSEERWYAINEYSGRLLAKWSALPIATGIGGFFVPKEWFVEYSSVAICLFVLSAIVPMVLTFRWIRRTGG